MSNADHLSFTGFDKPESNFFRLPNEWTDITAAVGSLAELKVVEYVLKHTWGYREFDVVKKITIDEFMRGRKTKQGSRIDLGTGLSKQAVLDGLAAAIRHGLLLVEVDDSDKARIKKYYKLRMKDVKEVTREGDFEARVNEVDPDVNKVDTGVQTVDSSGQQSRQRSETETQEDIFKHVQNVDKYIKSDRNAYQTSDLGFHSNGKSREEVDYFAQTLAAKLGDQKSLTYYKLLCSRYDPHRLLAKAAEIVGDGAARKPGAVFAAWIKTLAQPGISPGT